MKNITVSLEEGQKDPLDSIFPSATYCTARMSVLECLFFKNVK